MGKGDDPNCSAATAMLSATDGLPPGIESRPGILVWDQPYYSDTPAIVQALGEPLPEEHYARYRAAWQIAQARLAQLPSGNPHAWKDALDGYTCPRSGLTVQVAANVPYDAETPRNPGFQGGGMTIYTVIRDGQTPIGQAIFGVSLGSDGRCELRVANIDLTQYLHAKQAGLPAQQPTDKYLGGGFMRGYLQHVESTARQLGVARASVHATYVGALAWARLGFDWDPRSEDPEDFASGEQAIWTLAEAQADVVLTRLAAYARDGLLPANVPDEFRAWYRSLREPPTPNDLATWGYQHVVTDPRLRRPMPAAAAALRTGGDWCGVKILS